MNESVVYNNISPENQPTNQPNKIPTLKELKLYKPF